MTVNNIVKFRTAQGAIQAGEKAKALDPLKEIAQDKPEDPRPWLQMIYTATTKKEAREYLQFAIDRNAAGLAVAQMENWIEDFFDEVHTPATPKEAQRKYSWQKNAHIYVPAIYVVLLTIAESLTSLGDPHWGMVVHGISLISLLMYSTLLGRKYEQPFFLSLALTPLIRLLSLTLPLSTLPQIYWYAVIGLPLFIATYSLVRITGISREKIGLGIRKSSLQLLITLGGVALGYIEYLILRPAPLVAEFRFETIIVPALILLVFTGFLEELIFRGVFQYFSIRYLGKWGILYVALIFAVFHLGYRSVTDFLFVFVVSILFSYLVNKTGSIVGVTFAHGFTNIGLYLIFPFILASPTVSVSAANTSQPDQINYVYTQSTEQPDEIISPTMTEIPISTSTQIIGTIETETYIPEPCPTEEGANFPTLEGEANVISFIVDDGDDGFLRTGGNWWSTPKGVSEDLIWAYAVIGQPTAVMEWKTEIEMCGLYDVAVYIPCDYGTATAVSYQITYTDESSEIVVDQSANQGQWVQLGKF